MQTPETGLRIPRSLRRFFLPAAVFAAVVLIAPSVWAQATITLPGDTSRLPRGERETRPGGLADDSAPPAVPPDVDDVATGVGLESALFRELNIPEGDVKVSVTGDVVTIRGTVDTLLQRDRVGEIAQGLRGVERVVNRVTVRTPRIDDRTLLNNINAALAQDSVAGSLNIGVTVNDGVATLTGSVDSWQTQQLVTNVVKSVPGVRALNSRIAFTTPNRSDDEIRADIEHRLQMDRWVDPGLIEIQVNSGRVALTGSVGSLFERNRAVTDAWVPGVTHVASDGLQVAADLRDEMRRTRTEARLTDQEIRGAVSNAFAYNPRLITSNPEFYVQDGVVTLRGTVDTPRAKQAAEELAAGVVGVRGVNNLLEVRRTESEGNRPAPATAEASTPPAEPRPAPAAPGDGDPVIKAVRDAIAADERLSEAQISVTRNDDGVILFGIVDSEDAKSHAETVVASVNGVDKVVNNISVGDRWEVSRDGIRPNDEQILRDIKTSLNWSPFTDPDAITVTVNNGAVTLDGTVENWRASLVAARAARIAGATSIQNNLQVLQTAEDELRQVQQMQAEAAARAQQSGGTANAQPGVTVEQPRVSVAPNPAGGASAVPGAAPPGTVYYDEDGVAIVTDAGVGGAGVVEDPDAIDRNPDARAFSGGNALQGRTEATDSTQRINPNTAPSINPSAEPPSPQAGGTTTPDIDTGAPNVQGPNVGPGAQANPNTVPASPNQIPAPRGTQPGGTRPAAPGAGAGAGAGASGGGGGGG